MSLESTLERIAVALEAIADSKALPVSGSSSDAKVGSAAKTEVIAGATAQKRPNSKTAETKKVGEKVEEEKVETVTKDTDSYDQDAEPPKWPDVNKKLFDMLTEVTEAKGRPAAQDIYTTFKTKYSNGEKIGPGTVKPGLYTALLNDVNDELEALEEWKELNG